MGDPTPKMYKLTERNNSPSENLERKSVLTIIRGKEKGERGKGKMGLGSSIIKHKNMVETGDLSPNTQKLTERNNSPSENLEGKSVLSITRERGREMGKGKGKGGKGKGKGKGEMGLGRSITKHKHRNMVISVRKQKTSQRNNSPSENLERKFKSVCCQSRPRGVLTLKNQNSHPGVSFKNQNRIRFCQSITTSTIKVLFFQK